MQDSYNDIADEIRRLVFTEALMVMRHENKAAIDEIRYKINNLQVMKKLYET